jgi:hypothetical protein
MKFGGGSRERSVKNHEHGLAADAFVIRCKNCNAVRGIGGARADVIIPE